MEPYAVSVSVEQPNDIRETKAFGLSQASPAIFQITGVIQLG